MGNPYAQRVAPPALKRKASPTKVGRAAVAERELQALKKQSRKTRALYKGWQRDLTDVTEPDAEFLESVLTLAETAGSLAASSSEWELGKLSDDSAFADVVENRIDAALLKAAAPTAVTEPTAAAPTPAGALSQGLSDAEPTPAGAAPSALTQELAQARAELATASGALDATLATALTVKTAPASTVDFELSRFAEPPQPPIEAPLTNASIKFAESFGHPRRTRASTKPSYHKIEAALALKKKRPASSEANSILRASRRKGLTLQVIPFGDEASSPKTRNRKGAKRTDPPKTR